MTTLSYEAIYALARSVGCTDAQAIIAAAITQPESGRNPRNIGDASLSRYGSRGLWQLYTGAHSPTELQAGSGGWTQALADKLFDPVLNARGMWIVSNHGKTWRPWSTYNDGAYKPFLAAARAAAAVVGNNWAAHLPGATAPAPDPGGSPMSVTWRGVKVDKRTSLMLTEVAKLTRATITPTQGSYSSSVGASAGTHSGGGAVDVHAAGLPAADIEQIVKVMRQVGFAAWHRLPSQGNWPEHIHAIAVGCPDLSAAAAHQVTALRNGLNGLANGHKDPEASLHLPVITWEQYLAHRDGAPAPKPTVSVANVIAAAKADPKGAQGAALHHGDVLLVEKALVAEGLLEAQYADGSFGSKTVEAYHKWQESLGYGGADVGLPGRTSLAALGKKHGWIAK
jgi:hypothetical protein